MEEKLENLLKRLPNWSWLHMIVVLPYFLVNLPKYLAQNREAQKLEKENQQLEAIAQHSKDPELIFKASMRQVVNILKIYKLSN